jgi:glycosyltransferase 2 family protein
MKQHGWKWAIRLVGLVIFVLILFSINISATVRILLGTNLLLLALALLSIFPQIYLKAWRWHILMKMQNIEYPLKDAVTVYFSGLFIGTITPGRVGDFIKVQYLREEGYSFGKSFLSVFLDRCYDLAALILVGYVSILYFIQRFSTQLVIVSTILVLVPLSACFLYITGIVNKNRIISLVALVSPKRYRDGISKSLGDFFEDFSFFRAVPLISAFLITVATWVLYFMMSYWFALALSIPIDFLYLAGCVSIAAFIVLLPVSISGIGTRDAAFILLFGYAGITSESAVAYSTLILLMYAMNGLIGFIAWQKKPVSFRGSDEDDS